jgi:hypothetical protein
MRDPFPGNAVPATKMDRVATALLQRYPLPTATGTANNYRRVGNEPNNQDQFDVRLDHRFSGSDLVYGRYSYATDEIRPVTPLPDGSGNLTTGVTGPTNTLAQSFASNYVRVLAAHLVNELRSGYTRRSVGRSATALDAPPAQILGLPGLPANAAFQNTLPTFTIDGFQHMGSPASTASRFRTDVTQIVDTLSFQRGSHSVKAGLDFRWERLDIVQPPSPAGFFNFNTLFTNLPGAAGTGNSLASSYSAKSTRFQSICRRTPFVPARVSRSFSSRTIGGSRPASR